MRCSNSVNERRLSYRPRCISSPALACFDGIVRAAYRLLTSTSPSTIPFLRATCPAIAASRVASYPCVGVRFSVLPLLVGSMVSAALHDLEEDCRGCPAAVVAASQNATWSAGEKSRYKTSGSEHGRRDRQEDLFQSPSREAS